MKSTYIVTGPTSGIGRLTAFELAKHGALILVGRDSAKLDELTKEIKSKGGEAVPVICDMADLASVRRAAEQIVALKMPIAGLLNNAGIFPHKASKNTTGVDLAYATNHLGPFVFTKALLPHLTDGTTVVFVASGVEDPERKPAKAAGFRGARYISAEACARSEWLVGGAKMPGMDAYATSKQCSLATAFVLARENPRLYVNALEPGFIPNTELGRDAGPLLGLITHFVLPLIAPHIKYWSTPERAAKVATKVVLNASRKTGVYFDDGAQPMLASEQVRDPKFAARVIAETRELLSN
jgi:NAD(P)-dependent dehydrogenase (short-subunit alcohol dehydrogenase family)